MTATLSSTDQIAELERTVKELRADLEHLRRSLAEEVRTRRVVVVEPDGFERVILGEWNVSSAGVHIVARPQGRTVDGGSMTHLSLWASENDGFDGQESVGITLWGAGNSYLDLDLQQQENLPDETLDDDLREQWHADMTVCSSANEAAQVFDQDGVHPHPMRLSAVEQWEEARRHEVMASRAKYRRRP